MFLESTLIPTSYSAQEVIVISSPRKPRLHQCRPKRGDTWYILLYSLVLHTSLRRAGDIAL